MYHPDHSNECCTEFIALKSSIANSIYHFYRCSINTDITPWTAENTNAPAMHWGVTSINFIKQSSTKDITYGKVKEALEKYDAILNTMPNFPPISDALLKKWSLQMAKDLQNYLNTEARPDLDFSVSAGFSAVNFDPPSQVTEKLKFNFIFGATFKGKPGLNPGDKVLQPNDFSIKKLSQRIIKKC